MPPGCSRRRNKVSAEEDPGDLAALLVGSAVARRMKQLVPLVDENTWFAVAIAAKEVFEVIDRSQGDALEALDEWHKLEQAVQE
jgi:hypothetical protein